MRPRDLTDSQRGELAAWCASEWALKGRKQVAIGDELGISVSRVNTLIAGLLYERDLCLDRVYDKERAALVRTVIGYIPHSRPSFLPEARDPRARMRPRDMGGPRDVWLHFYPVADPRYA